MRLKKLSPILWTKDLNATVSFYTTVLGFTAKSNFPNFATLTRDGVEIMFIVPEDEPGDCKDTADYDFFPRPILTGSIYITMDEVDRLWESVKDRATIKTSLADRDYMMRDFSILDNNGYELVFGMDVSGSN
ncbi:MAG TPA: VOC family protein [Cyclobacteriaceae bacterium]|nr:VOC family protein [Cyclobacteriaceae bacterium]